MKFCNLAGHHFPTANHSDITPSTLTQLHVFCCTGRHLAHIILLDDFGISSDERTVLLEDSQAAIAMSQNPVRHARTKH